MNTSHRLSAWLSPLSALGSLLCGEFWGPDATEVWVEAEILLCGDTEEAQGPGRLREDGGPAFLEHCPAGPDLPPGPHHSCSSTDQRGLGLCSPGAHPLCLPGSADVMFSFVDVATWGIKSSIRMLRSGFQLPHSMAPALVQGPGAHGKETRVEGMNEQSVALGRSPTLLDSVPYPQRGIIVLTPSCSWEV